MASEYERIRLENIRKNKELLTSLGLDTPLFEPKEKRQPKKAKGSKKRKAEEDEQDPDDDEPKRAKKLQRNDSDTSSSSSVTEAPRRSARHAGKIVDYDNPKPRGLPERAAYSSGVKVVENDGPMGRESGKRTQNPKQYGHIPGVAVGTWWPTREGASIDAVHAPFVAGISGGPKGAHSVALSGGYEDDVDLGYAFTYTGSGGRDLKGTKTKPKNLRTAPQSSDQSFDHTYNRMLQQSCRTKKPVRVLRGFKGKSVYAPSEGYRYDGLYIVEKAWLEKGNNPKGYLVCKYIFKRLPGQPPLPVRASSDDEAEVGEDQEEEFNSDADADADGDDDEDADGDGEPEVDAEAKDCNSSNEN